MTVEGVVASHQPDHPHDVGRVEHDEAGVRQRLRGVGDFALPA